jgi:hypothetical protein
MPRARSIASPAAPDHQCRAPRALNDPLLSNPARHDRLAARPAWRAARTSAPLAPTQRCCAARPDRPRGRGTLSLRRHIRHRAKSRRAAPHSSSDCRCGRRASPDRHCRGSAHDARSAPSGANPRPPRHAAAERGCARASGRHAWTRHDQRDLYIGIVGRHLSGHQAEFTHVIAVVGAEDEVVLSASRSPPPPPQARRSASAVAKVERS